MHVAVLGKSRKAILDFPRGLPLRRTESQSVMKYLNQAMPLQSCPGQCAGIHFSIHNDITGFDRVNVQEYISVYTMTGFDQLNVQEYTSVYAMTFLGFPGQFAGIHFSLCNDIRGLSRSI